MNRLAEPESRPPRRWGGAGVLALATLGVLLAGCTSSSPAHRPNATASDESLAYTPAPTTPAPLPAGVLSDVMLAGGDAPLGLAAGFGSLWIATHRGQTLYRVDPTTGKVLASIPSQDCCVIPVAGAGHVWAGNEVIDPTTNKLVGMVNGGVGGVFTILDGIPWGATKTGLARIDPKTYKQVRTYPVAANPRGVSDPDFEVAYGDGAFWVIVVADATETFGGAVVKVDPRTGKSLHTYHVPDPGGYADIQFLDHAIWLKGDDSGRLVKLDTRTGRAQVFTLPGWQALSSLYGQNIALGEGDLWIRNSTAKVLRVSPRTGRVVGVYPASPTGNGGFEAIAFGSLWVANFDDDTIWRDRIPG